MGTSWKIEETEKRWFSKDILSFRHYLPILKYIEKPRAFDPRGRNSVAFPPGNRTRGISGMGFPFWCLFLNDIKRGSFKFRHWRANMLGLSIQEIAFLRKMK